MKNDLSFLLSRFVSENILMNHNRTNVYKKQTGVTALHDGEVIRNFTFYTLLTIKSFCLEILESPLRTDMNRTASTQLPRVPHYKTDTGARGCPEKSSTAGKGLESQSYEGQLREVGDGCVWV